MADPLAGHKDGQFDVEFDLAHLERGGVPVPHEVADQAFVVLHRFGAFAVGHAGGVGDCSVVAHVINDADEPVIEDLVRGIEVLFHARGNHAAGGCGLGALIINVGLLFWGNGHVGIPLGDSQATISRSVVSGNSYMRGQGGKIGEGRFGGVGMTKG